MDDYRPQSPDLSGFTSYNPEPASRYPQTQAFPPSFPQQANYGSPVSSAPIHPQQIHPTSNMPRNGRMKAEMSADDDEWAPLERAPRAGGRKGKKQKIEEDCGKPAPGVEEGIEVKTKFPVARIKRIMQADEDVGKVAQVTPTAVSKALELFMISVVTKSAAEAKSRGSKRVTAAHLKQAVEKDEQLDFLAEIISKVPDAPAPSKKEEDSEEAGEGKKKRGGRRKKKEGDDS